MTSGTTPASAHLNHSACHPRDRTWGCFSPPLLLIPLSSPLSPHLSLMFSPSVIMAAVFIMHACGIVWKREEMNGGTGVYRAGGWGGGVLGLTWRRGRLYPVFGFIIKTCLSCNDARTLWHSYTWHCMGGGGGAGFKVEEGKIIPCVWFYYKLRLIYHESILWHSYESAIGRRWEVGYRRNTDTEADEQE